MQGVHRINIWLSVEEFVLRSARSELEERNLVETRSGEIADISVKRRQLRKFISLEGSKCPEEVLKVPNILSKQVQKR